MKIPMLVGVTHNEAGDFIARVPRATKIAIGKPKGKALHVYLSLMKDGRTAWIYEIGSGKNVMQRPYELDQIDVLKRDYLRDRSNSETPETKFPEKLPYFTFFREAGDGSLLHDFDVIAKHGVKPRTIDIVLTDADPWHARYEFWSAKGLNCSGDGDDASRSIDFPQNDAERTLAAAAKANGQKAFQILDGCYTKGCPFAKPLVRNGKEIKQCGPHGRLSAQLINDIRLGAKAEYQTTGIRTIIQLSSAFQELATFVGQGNPETANLRGIPLQLSVGQFKTLHNGQPGTAYSVRLEFRAESIPAMRAKLKEAAENFGIAVPRQLEAPAKQLAAPTEKGDPALPTAETAAAGKSEEIEVVDAQYVGEVDDDDDIPNASYMDAQFDAAGGGDDEEAGEPQEESFEEARAAAMREAEVEAEPAKQAEEKSTAEEKSLSAEEFSRALGGARYEDPGEQNDRPKKGMRLT